MCMYTYTLPTYYIQRTMFFTSTYCRVRDFVLLQMWGRTLYSFGELLIIEFCWKIIVRSRIHVIALYNSGENVEFKLH